MTRRTSPEQMAAAARPPRYFFSVSLLGACLVLALPGCKKGTPLDMDNLAPFDKLYTPEEIKKGFSNLSTTPFGREDLALSLLVPNDWRDIPVKVPRALAENPEADFVPLTRQQAPEDRDGHASIEVRYIKVPIEVDLSDWVTFYLEGASLKPLLRRPGVYNGRPVDEAVVRVLQMGKDDYVARFTFSRHGDKIFLVVGSALADFYNENARIFGLAAVSFTPKAAAEEFAEPMTLFVNPGPPHLEFRYPESWDKKEPSDLPAGKVGVDVLLLAGEKTVGFLHVKATLKSPTEDPGIVQKKLRGDFEKAGVNIGERIRSADLDPKQDAPLAKIEVFRASQGGVPGELAVLVYQNATAYYALGALMPDRKGNPLAWMTTWRVFELAAADILARSVKREAPLVP